MLVASRGGGAFLIGAYDRSTLIGFVYGFPGYENGRVVHHSHMLAVKHSYRGLNLGYKLKLAPPERVLRQGIERITWTFDPLQSLKAYFNFTKLGVVADSYKINFYGEVTVVTVQCGLPHSSRLSLSAYENYRIASNNAFSK